MFVWEFDRQQSELVCLHCGAQGELYKFDKAQHVGTRCRKCDAWNTWLKQTPPASNVATFKQDWPDPPDKEKPPRYTPNQIAHPQTLEERVASLEHDLSILAQIIMGGTRRGK